MKKHVWLIAAVTALMVLFAGCDNFNSGANTGDDDTIPVSSIQILMGGTAASGTQTLIVGDEKIISARVLPNDTTEDKGYTLSIGNTSAEIATLGEDGKLKATGKGSFTLTAVSTGKNAQGNTVSAALQFSVKLDPQDAPLAFTVFDQKTQTSSALPSPNGDGRIEIFNQYADASFNGPGPGASTDTNGWVRNNTFVYLQKPLRIQPKAEVGPDDEAWIPYSIKARLRIAALADDITGTDDANMGVVIGIMTDPEDAVEGRHYFAGIRSDLKGQKKGFRGRVGDTSSGNLTGFVVASNSFTSVTNKELAAELDKADSAADKKAGYREQEYIYEVVRLRADCYLIRMFEPDGTEIITGRMDNSNGIVTQLQDANAYLYLGFMVAGVRVEISDIEVTEGDEAVLPPIAAHPQPYVDVPNRLLITTPHSNPIVLDDVEYQYAGSLLAVTQHQLAAVVYPLANGVSQNVSWSSSDELVATVDAAGLVTFNAGGTATITAVSDTDASKTHFYRYYITEHAINVETITVKGLASVFDGYENRLIPEFLPTYATDKSVVWSVKSGAACLEIVSQNADTGSVVIKGLAAGNAVLTVTAQDEGKKAVDVPVTVLAAPVTISKSWNFAVTADGNNGTVDTWKGIPVSGNANSTSGLANVDHDGLMLTTSTRAMRIDTNPAVAGSVEAAVTAGFTAAFLNTAGASWPSGYPGATSNFTTWATLPNITGPFIVKINWHPNNTDGARRLACMITGDEDIEGLSFIQEGERAGNTPKTTAIVYTGTKTVTVNFHGLVNAIRIHDVFLISEN